jgi:hypothetical protein
MATAFGIRRALFCTLLATIISATVAAPWDPRTIESFKSMSLDQLFAKYQAGADHRMRSQAAYLAEIKSRTNAVEFLSAKLKKQRGVPDTREMIEGREKAVAILGRLGERARPAVPMMVATLEDEETVRMRVMNALSELGPIAIEAKPALLEELQFQNALAARTLFTIAPHSEEVLEAVIAAVSDPAKQKQMFQHQTMESFDACKVKSDRVRRFLQSVADTRKDHTAEIARQRLQILDWKKRRVPSYEPATPVSRQSETALINELNANPDNYQTSRALAKCDPDTKRRAVSILLEKLKAGRVRFPGNVVSQLGLFGAEAKEALPLLISYAESDEAGPANNAMAAIGEIGPDAINAKPAVERALLDGSPLLRWRAANTLCLIDPSNLNHHLDSLTSTLKAEGEFSDFAIQSIGKFGVRASKAAPFLTELLKNEAVRFAAGEALMKVQPTAGETVARAIAADLKSDSVHAQDRAAKLLAEIGSAARDALPALREAAAGSDVELAKLAQEAIAKIASKKEGT